MQLEKNSLLKIACKGNKKISFNQKKSKIMAKKSKLIAAVYNHLLEMGKEEILHYVREFRTKIDYNIVEYGNLLVYYRDIKELMEYAEYKVERYTNEQIWNYYKHIVREVVNKYFLK